MQARSLPAARSLIPRRRFSAFALALTCAAGLAGGVGSGADAKAPADAPLEADGTLSPGVNPKRYLKRPGDALRLSNESTVTRWATAFSSGAIRRAPRNSARRIASVRFVSSSRTAEIYGLLRAVVDGKGRTWFEVRIPGRPNGRVGWTRARALNKPRTVQSQLVIDRKRLRATFYVRGEKIMRAPVGVGKASTPTPGGRFFVDRKEGAIFGPSYGPNILFTNAFSVLEEWPGGGAIGLHGTNSPQLVPGRPSHGCIRFENADIVRLARMVPVGTPLLIR